MKALIQKRLKNQRGLTLIELLVVIVILGIIAAIAIPMVMSNREDAAEAVANQTNAIIRDAVNRYEVVVGEATDDLDDLSDYLDIESVECPAGYEESDDLTNFCVPETT